MSLKGEKKTSKNKKPTLPLINESTDLVKQHISASWGQIKVFEKICKTIYEKLLFGGKEHHYQAALEEELRDRGFHVQQEIARTLHYKKDNNDVIQLPHDIRGREDLVLHKRYLILELKQTGKLTDKEFNQLCRYMHERKNNVPSWGEKTRGMLINFGDNNLEMWYLFYCDNKITRILICKEPRPSLDTLIDSFDASQIMG
jgi:GxxExxY protein